MSSKNRTKVRRRLRHAMRCALVVMAFAFAFAWWRRGSWPMFRFEPSPPPSPPPLMTFEFERMRTPNGPNGGPKEYGNKHPLDCGSNGAMTTFSFAYDDGEDEIHNEYECAVARNGRPTSAMLSRIEKSTLDGPSGSKMSGRDAMWDLDQHVVDCGNRFLRKWVLRQWSHSMKIVYTCAWQTSDAGACEHRQTTQIPRARKASEWANVELACSPEKFMTAFRFAEDRFAYTCCPKPNVH